MDFPPSALPVRVHSVEPPMGGNGQADEGEMLESDQRWKSSFAILYRLIFTQGFPVNDL